MLGSKSTLFIHFFLKWSIFLLDANRRDLEEIETMKSIKAEKFEATLKDGRITNLNVKKSDFYNSCKLVLFQLIFF